MHLMWKLYGIHLDIRGSFQIDRSFAARDWFRVEIGLTTRDLVEGRGLVTGEIGWTYWRSFLLGF